MSVLWDEAYRKAGPAQHEAARECAQWFLMAHCLSLAPRYAVIGYCGCLRGWQGFVPIGAPRPDLCDVVQCIEDHARSYPGRPADCDECEHYESYFGLRGGSVEAVVRDTTRRMFAKYESLLGNIARQLVLHERVERSDLAGRALPASLDLAALLASLEIRDA